MPIIYRGRVFSVEVDTRRFPDGRDHEVAVVRHPPSVVLIPIEHGGRLVLIKQYRASVDRELWELPAGSLEPGESADAAARRECEEEIGRAPARVERLGAWYPTPGFCDEELIFFRVSASRRSRASWALVASSASALILANVLTRRTSPDTTQRRLPVSMIDWNTSRAGTLKKSSVTVPLTSSVTTMLIWYC